MVGFGQVQGQVPGRRARALPAPATSQAKSLSLPDFRRSVSPNSSFKPTPLRYTKHMAGAACHVLCSTTRRGLTQVLALRSKSVAHYYHLDSSGEHTNLQLYSLKQAMRYWEELQDDLKEFGDETENIRERCVFILSSLGLS